MNSFNHLKTVHSCIAQSCSILAKEKHFSVNFAPCDATITTVGGVLPTLLQLVFGITLTIDYVPKLVSTLRRINFCLSSCPFPL